MGVWDPLGLSTSGNASDYKRRREVELKHGRVCMFATMGYIAPEYTFWRPVAFLWHQVLGCPEQPCCDLQGAGAWLGPDHCVPWRH